MGWVHRGTIFVWGEYYVCKIMIKSQVPHQYGYEYDVEKDKI